MKNSKFVTVVILLAVTSTSFAIDDTSENRSVQVERYLKAAPPSKMISDMAESMVANLPFLQRATFLAAMEKQIDIMAITIAMKESMLKLFTADELKAMADLYETPAGQSAMMKMGAYMTEISPIIETEFQNAVSVAQISGASARQRLKLTFPVE